MKMIQYLPSLYIYIYIERERERERERKREYITVLIDSTSKMNRCTERKTNEDVVFGRERERERLMTSMSKIY